ncbi:hypothetical protein DICPUDRAFT_76824 [Dictyostelium purpureum]|uniref:Uncharacterized protein n=1 Tax=Dictyostelium purpureum TaxID=5786 RepID=F0ZER4_DICPU|nr:uncharacterized protein DICPUDRAFT_76824 [Dictyostelium purpureum]EGC37585.1 hypothetical protein DICPUDRAFT_76824 [Dictyostelium purpureum]|eukprot:XP_003285911.1 hypothetical protein DICPUDRAFT_76824 [Dictyostelium purpureum]
MRALLPNSQKDSDNLLIKMKSLQENIPHLKSLYSGAGSVITLPRLSDILRNSTFKSSMENGSYTWSVKVEKFEYNQDILEETICGLRLNSGEIKEPTQQQTFKDYQLLHSLLKSIHKSHIELVKMFHHDFLNGVLKIKINQSLNDVQLKNDELKSKIEEWKELTNSLSNRTRLL